ncbi:MAG: leucine--tRNA ligase [Crocinitomicaceae bacterium]|nr:MAG: leucine--tRNA ligase [Crocinitomicaceae bacterium]
MEYNFREIESKWRKFWAENQTFKAEDNALKPKYYVLDMFPYPSGAGLHVGHPLGYIASDIFARYKRLQGFNVLHPMGYDSFGLPAEQYAIQTGQHPDKTTKENIARYREQLDKIGFSFDWSREVRTSNADYYKWTQWIFTQLFDCWYNNKTQKTERISSLIHFFATLGNSSIDATTDCELTFTAEEWNGFNHEKKEAILQQYRLAYLADSWVNWCPALGTVLANDEVINGVSERGGHPVEQKKMRQWSMRIKAYAERLISGLDGLDWTDSIKDQQRNWIGKSQGCSVNFQVEGFLDTEKVIEVFTTRPDTIFGVSFLVLAPEHPFVATLTTSERKDAVESYVKASSLKTERDRQANVKNISGEFLGSYAIHPFTGEKVELWIGDYVLASYGTGAVMAVPCGDQRDWDFATHFGLEIKNIFKNIDISEAAYTEKEGVIADSDFLSGLTVKEAIPAAINAIEEKQIGKGKTNFRLRDAVFSRQRYWGEPFPVYYKDGLPHMIDTRYLPVVLPEVENYLPTADGQPPLGNAAVWAWDTVDNQVVDKVNIDHKTVFPLELNTMPGWAGSSWYFLRYMDPHNATEFVSKEKVAYWNNVDLYIGGSEHATGHLLYARFWTKFLYDLGYISFDEPFQKMINQGMILGRSSLVYKASNMTFETSNQTEISNLFVSKFWYNYLTTKKNSKIFKLDKDDLFVQKMNLILGGEIVNSIELDSDPISMICSPRHVDISIVENDRLDIEAFKNSREEYKNAILVLEEEGIFVCGSEVEKMSKSKFNVQTPDELVDKFGADTLRMYEMFLGPLEQSKPWDTKGINGVHNFLRKLWRLFHDHENNFVVSDDAPSNDSLKTLHKTIQKLSQDLERFSFNTGVSNFMIAVNELSDQKCNNRSILRELLIMLSPYAPHIAEELWEKLGYEAGSINVASFPIFNPEYLVESSFSYPISFNGKVRFSVELPADMSREDVEAHVLKLDKTTQYLEGKTPKKMIVVPGRIVNIVV